MKTILRAALVAAVATGVSASVRAADISGAGATFPYPIYAKWADAYKKTTGNGMNYQSIGSGGGIKQITAKTVKFGASDMPMKGEDLESRRPHSVPDGDRRRSFRSSICDGIKPGELVLDGADPREDLSSAKSKPGTIPAIKKLNPNAKLAVASDRRRAPLRRFRHDVHLDRLPLEGQPGVEIQGRREHLGGMAGRHWRQGQ